MGETTGIAWSDATWNWVIGCRKVSQGCKFCYAETLVTNRMGRDFKVVRRAAPATFDMPLHYDRSELAAEIRATGRNPRVFSCSLSDFFIEEADAWRHAAWAIIRQTPNLTYQILTKRPERIADNLPVDWGPTGYPNVWLGTSGETIQNIEERRSSLLTVPARVHFLSAEPWLQTNPRTEIHPNGDSVEFYGALLGGFDWVILGGESGKNCRPFDIETARLVRDACKVLRIPLFLKQLGGYPDQRTKDKAILDGVRWTEFPDEVDSAVMA